jgi:phage-related tail protein
MGSSLQSKPVSLSQTLALTLHALIPKTESDVQQFHKTIEKSCREFDVRLESLTVPTSATGNVNSAVEKLGDIVNNLYTHFAAARRREVLSKARDLIVADYHNTMLASGDALEVAWRYMLVCSHVNYIMFSFTTG